MPRCIGRRYPDAEGRTYSGCLERPPPLVWKIELAGLTGDWAQYNGWQQIEYDMVGTGTQGPWDQFSQWRRTLIAGRVIVVRTTLFGALNQWHVWITLTQGFPGGGLGVRTYIRNFPLGFPKWEQMIVRVVSTTPLWTFGGSNQLNAGPALYGDLPANFCDV